MKHEPLFRQEVIEYRRRRLLGDVIVVQPLGQSILTAALTVSCFVGLAFLAAGTYSKTETVPGYLAPAGGIVQVYANRGGIVAGVSVHEDDVVTSGTPLVVLSLETAGTDGAVGEKFEIQTRARMAETDRQIDSAGTRFADDTQKLKARIRSIRSELASMDLRLSSEAEMLKLQQEDVRRYGELQRTGDGTYLELSRRRQLALTQESAIEAQQQQRQQRRSDLNDMEAELVALPTEYADKISKLRSLRSELQQSLAQLEINSAYQITAPVTGRIAALQATVGQNVGAQTPLAAIIPEASSLEATLLVPPRALGLIQVGQDVRVRIDAFPYQRFGALNGRVMQISKASYKPGELLAPVQYAQTVYRVIVELDRTHIAAYGEERPLTPGMTLTADVVTDRRHFIDWMLDPLRAIHNRTVG